MTLKLAFKPRFQIEGPFHRALDVIDQHIQSIKELDFYFAAGDVPDPADMTAVVIAAVNRILECQLPVMKHLKLTVDRRDRGCSVLSSNALRNILNLRSISLDRCVLPALKNWASIGNLTSLELKRVTGVFGLSDLVTLLLLCTNLESFTLRDAGLRPVSESDKLQMSRGELRRCKKLDIDLPSTFLRPPHDLLTIISFPELDFLSIQPLSAQGYGQPMTYHTLPEYIQRLIMRSKTLFLKGTNYTLEARYFMENDIDIAKQEPNYLLRGIPAADYSELGKTLAKHPSIASVLKNLPSVDITRLSVDGIIQDHHHRNTTMLQSWPALFRTYPSVRHLEVRSMMKMITITLCKALADPNVCPDLDRLEIDWSSFNEKELKKMISRRKSKAGKVGVGKLYLWDFGEGAEVSLRQIPSNCAIACFTNCGDIVAFNC